MYAGVMCLSCMCHMPTCVLLTLAGVGMADAVKHTRPRYTCRQHARPWTFDITGDDPLHAACVFGRERGGLQRWSAAHGHAHATKPKHATKGRPSRIAALLPAVDCAVARSVGQAASGGMPDGRLGARTPRRARMGHACKCEKRVCRLHGVVQAVAYGASKRLARDGDTGCPDRHGKSARLKV